MLTWHLHLHHLPSAIDISRSVNGFDQCYLFMRSYSLRLHEPWLHLLHLALGCYFNYQKLLHYYSNQRPYLQPSPFIATARPPSFPHLLHLRLAVTVFIVAIKHRSVQSDFERSDRHSPSYCRKQRPRSWPHWLFHQ